MLEEKDLNYLKLIVNDGTRIATDLLNEMYDVDITIKATDINSDISNNIQEYIEMNKVCAYSMPILGNIEANSIILYNETMVHKILDKFSKYFQLHDTELIRNSSISEISNIILNCIIGELNHALDLHSNYLLPNYDEDVKFKYFINIDLQYSNPLLILVNLNFGLEDNVDKCYFLLAIHNNCIENFISKIQYKTSPLTPILSNE